MRPHSGPFLSKTYGGSLRSLSSHRIWGPPKISFFANYGGLLMSVFCTLYRGPSDQFLTFFHYYIGALSSLSSLTIWGPLRSVSSHTIWGLLSNQFLCLQYAPPPPSDQFLCMLQGPATSDQFLHKIYGVPSDQFLRLLYGDPSG